MDNPANPFLLKRLYKIANLPWRDFDKENKRTEISPGLRSNNPREECELYPAIPITGDGNLCKTAKSMIAMNP